MPHDATSEGPVHAVCQNCQTPLAGRYCHACGQVDHPHRTLAALGEELLEGVTHSDGRLWKSLGLLIARPGRLTRDWIEGRRQRHLAPLHLFLFAMFLLFLAMGLTDAHLTPLVTDPAQMGSEWRAVAEKWTKYPELTRYKIDAWAYKLTFMIVPLALGGLALLMVGKRRFTAYDYGVFVLNEAAFIGFLAFGLAVVRVLSADTMMMALSVVLAIHATFHLRGAFGLSWFGAAVRGVLLAALATVIMFLFFYIAVFAALLL